MYFPIPHCQRSRYCPLNAPLPFRRSPDPLTCCVDYSATRIRNWAAVFRFVRVYSFDACHVFLFPHYPVPSSPFLNFCPAFSICSNFYRFVTRFPVSRFSFSRLQRPQKSATEDILPLPNANSWPKRDTDAAFVRNEYIHKYMCLKSNNKQHNVAIHKSFPHT